MRNGLLAKTKQASSLDMVQVTLSVSLIFHVSP